MELFEAIFEKAVKAGEERYTANEGDYEENGLLYCGKCRTPKQAKLNVLDVERLVPIACKCVRDAEIAAETDENERRRAENIHRLKETGFPDSRMQNWNFANDDHSNEKLSSISENFVKNYAKFKNSHKGLLMFGGVGTGKTFAAACIANALMEQEVPCYMTNFSRLVNKIQAMRDDRQEFIDSLCEYDVLIIDDFASERDTSYMNEIVYNVIDTRYRSGLPLIVTSNISGDELKNPKDMDKQRIFSRLLEMCHPIAISGTDRRKTALKEEYNEYNSLLGIA